MNQTSNARATIDPPRGRIRRSARGGTLRSLSLLCVVAACGPKPAETCDADPDGCPSSDDGDPGVTTAEESCGPPPTPLACPKAREVDPRTKACALRDQANCDGLLEDIAGECMWVETTVFTAHDGATCADAGPSGACVALYVYGDGCAPAPTTCGDDRPGSTFFRVTESCAVEVFQRFFCGYTVLDWDTRAWEELATCSAPWPSHGPGVCNCGC